MAVHNDLETIITIVQRFIEKVNERFPVEHAFLFGSYALGIETDDSDIDVAIVSSAFSGSRFDDNVSVATMTWGIDTRIEPVAFRPERFNDDDLLASEILRYGIEIPLVVRQPEELKRQGSG